MAVPKGRGYDSVFFESSLAWTQANLARIVWVQLSLDPGQIGPRDVAESAEPWHEAIGPNEGGRIGHPLGWKSARGKLQHGGGCILVILGHFDTVAKFGSRFGRFRSKT